MSSDNKVKGLLKGLRFISQIFDNEKEPEIQIGNPTDVRHVAHIGWDGPSENSPSWMHEFKSVPGIPSAHPKIKGDNQCKGSDNSVEWVSTDSKRRGSGGSGNYHQGQEDTAELTKSSRRHSNSTGNMRESHAKEKSDRPRQTKRSSKHHSQSNESLSGSKHTEQQPMSNMDSDSLQLQGSHELPPRSQQDNNNTRRSHSKKTKDACSGGAGAGGVSSKSRPKAQTKDPNSNEGPHSRSSSKTRNKHRHSEEDGQVERGSSEDVLRNYSN